MKVTLVMPDRLWKDLSTIADKKMIGRASLVRQTLQEMVEVEMPKDRKMPPPATVVRSTPDQRWDPTIVHRTPEDLRSAALVGMPALNRKRRDAGLEPLSAEEYLAMD